MAFIKKGVVIPLGSVGDCDDIGMFTPSAVQINDKIYCYYIGINGDAHRVCLAVSEDGFNFIKKGVVLPLGSTGDCDDFRMTSLSLILVNDKVYCYYAGHNGSTYRACLAVSEDGFNFIKKGVVIPLGDSGDCDETGIYNPSAVLMNDKIYCYYSGSGGGDYKICLAISEDGLNFTKKGVVVPIGDSGDCDDLRLTDMSVSLINDKVYCYYAGHDGSAYRVCLAVSEDGVNFAKKGVVLPLGSNGNCDDIYTLGPCAVPINDKVYCYYVGHDGSTQRVCLAISEDGF